ncbi:hypothetical protein [Dictyobacter kobayashii]|uniref:Uncharacterized protein n=1 Tax=Dictyobacter kobayashii TaxID=2014872 RepID=A0A402AU82_9CHLR|nr:hypothetical protein [Dictyobacter kobayashii]GCE22680.1 hypothetical protein KDK_64800 [Dictyobacter kobayashii]
MPEQENRPQDVNAQPTNPEQFQAAREAAEQKIDQAIDQFASKIPGAEQYVGHAKEAASGVLNNLEKEAEGRLGGIVNSASGILGGLFGKRKKEEPPPS